MQDIGNMTINEEILRQRSAIKRVVVIEEIFKEDSGKEIMISTQDNVVLNASQGENELGGDSRNKSESRLSEEVIPIKKKKVEMQQEIRVSERLKKDMGTRIEENNRRMVVKRNLEGNAQKTDKISCLPSKGIITLSKKMGVKHDNQNFESLNLLKEMEIARHNLNEKRDDMKKQNKEVKCVLCEANLLVNESESQDEENATNDFILV